MPFGDDDLTDEIGLALSGGGFRATLFHVGSLRRLTELGILPRVGRISSVSGGSIVSGRLAEVWEEFSADPSVEAFDALVLEPLRVFCRLHIDAIALSEGVLSPTKTAADIVEAQYAEHLFARGLDALPDAPTFVFVATNMQTGRSFRFTKAYLANWRLGLIKAPTLPVARAVAASSAFPPFFSPVVMKDPGTFVATAGADLNGDADYTDTLYLADGGVYDNLGLETIWNRCKTVLVSDAGAPFSVGAKPEKDWVRQSMRALDVATDQSRALRKRALVADFTAGSREGGYWGIDTKIADYAVPDALPCADAKVRPLAAIRTRLNPFTEEEQGMLINWGYAIADAATRRYSPGLITNHVAPTWPVPAFALA